MSHTFKQQKNRLLLSLILLTALLMPHPALADEEYGRYRAIVLHEGGQANSSGSIVPSGIYHRLERKKWPPKLGQYDKCIFC